jgi:hypothetical protein
MARAEKEDEKMMALCSPESDADVKRLQPRCPDLGKGNEDEENKRA